MGYDTSCYHCRHLDKNRIAEDVGHAILYGCNSKNRAGTVVGWVHVRDGKPDNNHLKWMGGSCFEEPQKVEQLSLF
jgi:hypothetical protein